MDKIQQAVETYLAKLYRLRSTGGATAETSFYSALEEMLNAIGHDLKPKVFCLSQLADQGAGHPDLGLFTAPQCQRGQPRQGVLPERGVVRSQTAEGKRLVHSRNASGKQVLGPLSIRGGDQLPLLPHGWRGSQNGKAASLEGYQLATTEEAFWEVARTAQSSAKAFGKSFGEYLRRALTQSAFRFANRRTLPGSSLRTPATRSRECRPRERCGRWRPFATRLNKRWASGSKARKENTSSARPLFRHYSMASFPAGYFGRSRSRRPPGVSTGGQPSGI